MKKLNAHSIIYFFAALQMNNSPLLDRDFRRDLPLLMQVAVSVMFYGIAATLFFIGAKEATKV